MHNSRRTYLKTMSYSLVGALSGCFAFTRCSKKNRPNILWIIGEDLSTDLNCYGEKCAHTPHLDALAAQGMRFNNAFTTAPVCSASRSAIMTGMYQTSIGAHNHRSHRDDGYQLPDGVNVITKYFRNAGYFTANMITVTPEIKGSGKTDWNFNCEHPFDGDDWNQALLGQPFFAQVNFSEAHRPFKRSETAPVDPAKVNVPPYYPEHPLVRDDWALYLDTINHLDAKVGAVLKRLESEGLAENTIVFFFGDHGRAMPRAKQWLYDPGLHVPLIIRWPGQLTPGSVNDDMISSIDIAAASLNLAGIIPPLHMQGRDFLGTNYRKRDFIVAARDRCDETVDRIRCVRTNRFKYIRNYYSDRPYLQLNRYKETEYATIRLLRRLHHEGKLNADQNKFLANHRPAEELYDLKNDPHELNNLADSREYRETMWDMRQILDYWIEETGDVGEQREDPAIVKKYLKKMQDLYDKRLEKLYREEGMDFLSELQ